MSSVECIDEMKENSFQIPCLHQVEQNAPCFDTASTLLLFKETDKFRLQVGNFFLSPLDIVNMK